MTNRKSRISGKSLKFSSPFAKKRDEYSRSSRARQHIFRGLLVESLERRELMAADVGAPLQAEGEAAALASLNSAVDLRPRLLSVAPNSGQILASTPAGTPTLTTLNLQSESPTELVFRFDGAQQLDANTLTGIKITRAGGDGKFDGTNDAVITPGFLGFGENQRIVIARFSSPLPDDLYRIEILAEDRNGLPAIRNTSGDALQPQVAGTDRDTYYFNVELGVQVVAVVPQPTSSNSNGVISRSANLIEVDFNSDNDKLNLPATSTDIATRSLFQLIKTQDTVTPNDDEVILPTQVNYDATQNRVGLVFAKSLDADGAATYRLRIGTQKLAPSAANPAVPVNIDLTNNNPGGNTSNASNAIGTINGAYSAVITQEIRTVDNSDRLLNNYPGGSQDPGERNIQDESHIAPGATADSNPEITTRYYSFLDNTPYGTDSQGRPVTTAISDIQKQRVREVMEFYSEYLGIDFVETTGLTGPNGSIALQIVVGDLLGPVIGTSGPEGYVSYVTKALNDNPTNNTLNLGILDGSESWDNDFGFGTQPDKNIVQLMADWRLGSLYTQILSNPPDTNGPNFFVEAMRVVGSLLGLGQSNDLPPGTIQGFDPLLGRPANPLEQIFPGDNDIVDGQFLYRPDNRDVDLYRFVVAPGQTGTFSAETIAERLMNSSNLDTHLTLLRQYTDNFGRSRTEIVAANDDYFSEDSLIRLHLEAGTYYVAVTAKGNQDFDPDIAGSGSGGTSQGKYQLRIDFRPDQPDTQTLRDAAGTSLDGDGDGLEGGTFDFWFRAAPVAGTEAAGAPRTLYVSKLYSGTQTGSLTQPFNTISAALAAARPNDIVRIVGNGGADNNFATVADNRAYEIGNGGPVIGTLSDGANLVVPQGVTLMIDGGAIIKFGNSRILVGSNDTTTDRSGAAIQVLGTPKNRVIFTSYTDESVGIDTNPLKTTPAKGDWGGVEIRNDFDNSQGRLNRERQGAFLNYISNADFRYGGGQVAVGGTPKVVNPIDLSEARATIINNRITNSADAAMSADPNSFEETLFTEPRYQGNAPFTPDYTRVGPVIRGNILADNTINGLFIRVDTLAGQDPKSLTVTGRINETDITIVMGENLTVKGTPGGGVAETARPNVAVAVSSLTDPTAPSTGLAAGTYNYVVTFVDAFGSESLPSLSFGTIAATANKAVRLTNLPTAQGDYVGRKLYRQLGNGTFQLVAELNSQQTTYVDQGATLLGTLSVSALAMTSVQRARRDASLIIDPGVVVKSQGSRIEVGMGATMIAEGTDAKPIIFTSTADDRYGKGGTFDTNGDGINVNGAAPGDWSGIVAMNLSTLSLDSVVVSYGGGSSRVPGGFASFNAIEIHQAEARIANSTIENNASGAGDPGTTRRAARGVNDAAAIYVSGAQPIIINNTIRNNSEIAPDLLSLVSQNGETAAISIDPNSMKATPKSDYGRSIGVADPSLADSGNLGPLVSGNKLGGNAINGMRIRGGTMTTEGVWDDTDIVHVVQKEIVIPDFHEYGGLRLQSSVGESLVVKLAGSDAGFTATGRPLDITDRIGGSLQIIGAPGFPVVLTSLKDDTIGAGFDYAGRSMLDTNSDGSASTPAPGDWRSVRLDAYSNDRNVAVTYEFESKNPLNVGFNNTIATAQEIGSLAPNLNAGDENLRLGITVTGTIAADSDRDIYKFTGTAGTMVWFDIDRTSTDLDSVVELVDAQGRIIAQSDNSIAESVSKNVYFNPSLVDNNQVFPLDQSAFAQQNANSPTATDFQSTNPLDAGFRMVLPGTPGTSNDYYVRVRSSNLKPGDPTSKLQDLNAINQGLTHGSYRLQLRLQQEDEIGGSTVRLATAKYATNAIEVLGGPMHSPILGEFSESSASETATGPASAINVGNVLEQDRAATSIAGTIGSAGDVDWYRFTVQRQLSSNLQSNYHTSVVFDLDYADALGRANTSLWVYQSNNGVPGNLVLFGRDSDIADDRSAPGGGSGTGDLSRGSFGSGDAFIGAAELPPGEYMVAVTNNSLSSIVLQQYQQAQLTAEANPLTRLEPIDSILRVSDDRDFTGSNIPNPLVANQVAFSSGAANGVPYNLSDVNLYVGRDRPTNATQSQLLFGNGMTGAKEAQGSDAVGGIFTQSRVTDIAVSPAGRIVGPNVSPTAGQFTIVNDNNTGGFTTVLASGGASIATTTNIQTNEAEFDAGGNPSVIHARDANGNMNGIGMDYTAVAFAQDNNNQLALFAVGQRANRQDFDRPVIVNINNAPAFRPTAPVRGADEDYITPAVNDPTDPKYIGGFRNILYRLDPNTQAGISPAGYGDRFGVQIGSGTGTQVREFGVFAEVSVYSRDRILGDRIVVTREARGDIIGITQVGQYIYGVTNQGELWRMDTNANGAGWVGGFQGAVLIATNVPANLTSLTHGPRDITIDANTLETVLNVPANTTGGTFTLTVNGFTPTAALNYNATAAQVQSALETRVGVGNVKVTGGPAGANTLSIVFTGTMQGQRPAVTIATNFTANANPAKATLLAGQANAYEFTVDRTTNTNVVLNIFNPLTFATAPFQFAANGPEFSSANSLQAALNNVAPFSTSGADAFVVQMIAPNTYRIILQGPRAAGIAMSYVSGPATLAQDNGSALYEVGVPVAAATGTFQLQLGSERTNPINIATMSVGQVQAAINALPSVIAAGQNVTILVTNNIDEIPGNPPIDRIYKVIIAGPGASALGSLSVFQSTPLLRATPVVPNTLPTQTITTYNQILVGVRPDGTLFAFDTNGVPQNIFPGGVASTVTADATNGISNSATGGSDVAGIDFGALDVNLWHTTDTRAADAGHGTLATFNDSRDPTPDGGNSLYFGFRDNTINMRQQGDWTGIYDIASQIGAAGANGNYNLPGGARGALQSNPINLTGYTADDQPTLYFNYLLNDEASNSSGADTNVMRDSFRVYGLGPDNTWILLGTNNSYGNDDDDFNRLGLNRDLNEYDVPVSRNQDQYDRSYRTQELFDDANKTGGWRQARINLSPLAGMSDAVIRFEFSTGGDFRTGDPNRAGVELIAQEGAKYKANDTFSLQVNGATRVFQFVVGNEPLTAGATAIPINASMTAPQVRDAIRLALARAISNDTNTIPYPIYGNSVVVFKATVLNSGPLKTTDAFDRTGDLFGPYTGPTLNPLTGQWTATKNFDRAMQATLNNSFEGVYLDDIIVGFAERGEQVFNPVAAGSNIFSPTPFYEDIGGPNGVRAEQVELGSYQLEIRPGREYGFEDTATGKIIPFLPSMFDTNDRLTKGAAIVVSKTTDVADGDQFTLSDGINTATFEFDLSTNGVFNGVSPGTIAVRLTLPNLNAAARSGTVAKAIRNAINGTVAQSILKITAGVRGQMLDAFNQDIQQDSSNIVELYGAVASNIYGGRNFSNSPAIGSRFYGGNNPLGGEPDGDSNVKRDQGQVIIDSNTVVDSANYGILVSAGLQSRNDLGPNVQPRPYPGSVRNLITLNTENLVTGPVVVNNVVARSGVGAIHIAGDAGPVSPTAPAIPPKFITRVINNTLYGNATPTGTGILVDGSTSPTLVNNIISNFVTGLSVGTGATVVAGGNLYKGNTTTRTGVAAGTFDIVLGDNDPLFANTTNDRFYLAPNSKAIDSSLASLQERTGLTQVKSGVQLPTSPLIAPTFDVGGLRRVDDPLVNTPVGQGSNVFIDRGAVDRSDFIGPGVILTRPIDNDLDGVDTDASATYVKLAPTTAPIDYFELLIDERSGTGPDPDTINQENVILTEDGRVLTPGIDYEFGYSVNSRTIRLTPLAGFWREGKVYEVTINNRNRYELTAPTGDKIADGDQFTAIDSLGGKVVFEYDTGTQIQLPSQAAIFVPDAGGAPSAVKDTDRFTIVANGKTVTFELDNNQSTIAGTVAIPYLTTDTKAQLTAKLVDAIQSSTLGVTPVVLSDGRIVLNNGTDVQIDTSASSFTQPADTLTFVTPEPTSVVDGQTFTVSDNQKTVTFEFDSDGTVAAGNVGIAYSTATSSSDLAALILTAINGADLFVKPVQAGNVLSLGLPPTGAVSVGNTALRVIGMDHRITDGQTIAITEGSQTITFEFDSNGTVANGRIKVPFTTTQTPFEIAQSLAQVMSASNLTFDAVALSDGSVSLKATTPVVVNVGSATNILVSGQPGVTNQSQVTVNSLPIDANTFTINNNGKSVTFEFVNTSIDNVRNVNLSPIFYTSSTTPAQIAVQIAAAIRSSTLGLDSTVGGNVISFKDNPRTTYDLSGTPSLSISGIAGGVIAIPISRDSSISAEDMAIAIRRALQSATSGANPIDTSLTARIIGGDLIMLDNATSVTGAIDSLFLPGVKDLAGNYLTPNRVSNETQFTILMPGVKLDYGDAADPFDTTPGNYPTLSANGGAGHVILEDNKLWLGAGVSADVDGKPSVDGNADTFDDGVKFSSTAVFPAGFDSSALISRQLTNTITVTASSTGYVDAWIDYNADGDWNDPGEQILTNVPFYSDSLTQTFTITVPATAPQFSDPKLAFARFRISSDGNTTPTGLATSGEVEDYRITLLPNSSPPVVSQPIPDQTTNEDTVLRIPLGAYITDPDSFDKLTYTAVSSDPTKATVKIEGNDLVITPVLNKNGKVTITVTGTDLTNFSVSDAFDLTIVPVNDAPVGVADAYTVPINRFINTTDAKGTVTQSPADDGVLANDIDVDGDTLTATLVSGPTKGTLTLRPDGTFNYRPLAGQTVGGTDTFTYQASDPSGAKSGIVTVTITFGATANSPHYNSVMPTDVDNSGVTSSIDVLSIINLLNANRGRASIPVDELTYNPPPFRDVNNDFFISSLDVLAVVNYLNARSRGLGGEGESSSVLETSSNSIVAAPMIASANGLGATSTAEGEGPAVQVTSVPPATGDSKKSSSPAAVLDSVLADYDDVDEADYSFASSTSDSSLFDAAIVDLTDLPNNKK